MTDPAAAPGQEVPAEGSLVPLARAAGFRDPRIVAKDAANAALVRARGNPNTLVPGDRLVVPPLEPKVGSAATGQVTRFTVTATALLLTVQLLDADGKPVAGRTCRFVFGSRDGAGGVPRVLGTTVTSADGKVTTPLDDAVTDGELQLFVGDANTPVEATIRLLVGRLEPASTIRGQQVRLNNLGYFAGFTPRDTDQLAWAIEEFQQDHGLKPTGRSDDPTTFNKIAHVHGDLLPSEAATAT